MFTVIVDLRVRPEHREEFLTGIRANAHASLRNEPGCVRFDVHERVDEPNRFLLHEVYTAEAAFREDHRSAPHYRDWQDVASRCVVPGSHVNTYASPCFPADIKNATGTTDATGRESS